MNKSNIILSYYKKALRLYPNSYYRRYAKPMAIVLEDIFADKDLTKKQKSIKYANAWLDLVRTVPRQHLLSDRQKALRNPKKYYIRKLKLSVLLSLPLIVSLVSLFIWTKFMPQGEGGSIVSSAWFSSLAISVWMIALPILSMAIAIYTLGTWYSLKPSSDNKRKLLNIKVRLALICLFVLSICGLLSLSFVSYSYAYSMYYINHNKSASALYQVTSPTLACSLLPLSSVREIYDKNAYMDNGYLVANGDIDYSGIVFVTQEEKVTRCNYLRYASSIPFSIIVHDLGGDKKNLENLRNKFNTQAAELYWQPITLFGLDGYYNTQQYISSLSFWIEND